MRIRFYVAMGYIAIIAFMAGATIYALNELETRYKHEDRV